MSAAPDYRRFLDGKAVRCDAVGFEADRLSDHLFPFQRDVVAFLLRVGRGAAFLDTGLGKTLIQLDWARAVAEHTGGDVLVLTPLAVAGQTAREAHKFGIEAHVARDQASVRRGINIANYERLHLIDAEAFAGVVLDESSILKSFTGKTRQALCDRFGRTPYRLACTATPAPNDHTELGNHADFLGVMSRLEMLSRFFINDTSTASQEWRLKRHAEAAFWDWMASWARMAEKPSDLGHDDDGFDLPPLNIRRHAAIGNVRPADGMLFGHEASATALHDLKRQTIDARADVVAGLVAADAGQSWVIWCDTDYEADALLKRIPDAIDVRGSLSAEAKEDRLTAFATTPAAKIITKPSLAGFGLNWQHCARMAFVGRGFSYEAWYQAVRRCWRFGQTRPVDVHIVVAEGEDQIGRVIDRKADDHAAMKRAMTLAMKRAMGRSSERMVAYEANHKGRTPAWL
jgi:superfamily II DNA or RNA helicase